MEEPYVHYEDWRKTRLNTIAKYMGDDFFQNKTVLELGCFTGDIGHEISKKGGKVTSSDAKPEHVASVNLKYPELNAYQLDCDGHFDIEYYDVIINFGLLYHLSNLTDSILSLRGKCKYLIVECEVCDSDDVNKIIITDESGPDQAYYGKGSRPSPKYIEKLLTEAGYEYKLIKDPELNSGFHIYDWEIENTSNNPCGLRRFWICNPL
jgi:SAM-dependent methyltransferase